MVVVTLVTLSVMWEFDESYKTILYLRYIFDGELFYLLQVNYKIECGTNLPDAIFPSKVFSNIQVLTS